MEIFEPKHNALDREAIALDVWQKRRAQRRRRVAKRITLINPIFVVQEMQAEFPGYTWDDYVADMAPRKRRKKKSKRKIRTYRFDWPQIFRDAPDIFDKCFKRTPTRAVFRLKKGEDTYQITVRSVFENHQQQQHLGTFGLVQLLRGTLRAMLTHPAVTIEKEKNTP